MRIIWVCLLVMLTAPAAAQEVRDCSVLDGNQIVLNPLGMNGRTYANGEVSIAVVHDARGNAHDSLFILVHAPDPVDKAQRKCHMIGKGEGRGYADIRLEGAQPNFTAADGLTVVIPARIFRIEDGFSNTTLLSVNVNRATNEITVTQELGSE